MGWFFAGFISYIIADQITNNKQKEDPVMFFLPILFTALTTTTKVKLFSEGYLLASLASKTTKKED